LSYINEGLNYLDNSYTLASINTFNAAVNKDVSTGLAARDAALKNRNLLQITRLEETRPERINSFEAGYKSILLDNKLVVDIDAYVNQYEGFLGQVEVSVPYRAGDGRPVTQATVGSDEAVVAMLAANRTGQQTRYRVYTNAKNVYNNFGSSLGLTYNFYQKYTVAGSVSYNDITKNKQSDFFVTGFNTPNLATNVSFGNRQIAKNLGFNIVWKWQDGFLWESPLVTGQVPSFNTFDAQVSYRLTGTKALIKAGGTNIFNKDYVQYAGGPTLGGLYYIALTFDSLFK
jgi:iron complex outermembrane recepter protein